MAEVTPGAEDDAVLTVARSDKRSVLNEDKDFGRLAYADGKQTVSKRRSSCSGRWLLR